MTIQVLDVWVKPLIHEQCAVAPEELSQQYSSAMPLVPVEVPSGPTTTIMADPYSIMSAADGTA